MEGPAHRQSSEAYLRKVRQLVPAMGKALVRFYGRGPVEEAMHRLVAHGVYSEKRLRELALGPPHEEKWKLLANILGVLGVPFGEFLLRFLQEQLPPEARLSPSDQATLLLWSAQQRRAPDTPPPPAP